MKGRDGTNGGEQEEREGEGERREEGRTVDF